MKALLGSFNQEKALVGAFSVITNLRMDLFQALAAGRAAAAVSRYVTAEPKWAKQLEGEVELGQHEVTFTAASPGGGGGAAACTLRITVKDTEPPRVVSCPASFEAALARGQQLRRVR